MLRECDARIVRQVLFEVNPPHLPVHIVEVVGRLVLLRCTGQWRLLRPRSAEWGVHYPPKLRNQTAAQEKENAPDKEEENGGTRRKEEDARTSPHMY